jgi:Ca2+-binding RTX toxin-like protein
MRKRVILLIATMTAALVIASGVALAANISCPNRAGNLCVGTNNKDTMTGTARADDMRGRDRADRMSARAGNDRLTGGLGGDVLSGQGDSDRYLFAGGWGQDRIPADGEGSGMDTLDFSAQTSSLLIDLIPSAGDEAYAGAANTLNFPSSVLIEDVLGGSGSDAIYGNDANNGLSGNGDDDFLEGRAGNDALNGGDGQDVYSFKEGWGVDTLADASGMDTLDFSALISPVTVRLTPSAGNEAVSGANTLDFPETVVVEEARGGVSDDVIRGNSADNHLFGNGGNDNIYGSSSSAQGGTDYMYGGAGNDYMQANSDGIKTYYGDEGNDEISGNGYSETAYGGTGTDTVITYGGDDIVDVADGDAGDNVDCHVGTNDTVYVDRRFFIGTGFRVVDSHQNCENVIAVIFSQ